MPARRRDASRRTPPLIAIGQVAVRPLLRLVTRRHWIGLENLPATGGAIVVCNHLSVYDPFAIGNALLDAHVPPRFLAKDSLFEVPVLRGIMRATGQIPVRRGTRQAGDSVAAAGRAVAAGEIVTVFPEGTLTRDPEDWPMRARLGAARIALATGAPVIPAALWGTRAVWPRGAHAPRLLPRHDVTVAFGPAFTASQRDDETEHEAAIRVTTQVMGHIVPMVGVLRGRRPPAVLHDPRTDAFRPEEGARR